MTPEREMYFATLGEREKWLRQEIKFCKNHILVCKRALDPKYNLPDLCMYKGRLKIYKYHLTAYRHELARMKGMDRVVLPMEQYNKSLENDDWYCSKCEWAITPFGNYCSNCGRRILWKKVE